MTQEKIQLAEDEYIEVINFGDLKAGDVIVGSSGLAEVVNAYDEHLPESMYEIETDSGIKMRLSGNHLIYVITANDRDLHSSRLKSGAALGKSISKESVELLKEIASEENHREVYIAEFEDFLEPKSKNLTNLLIRVGESLGPIAESNLYVDDLGGNEKPLYQSAIYLYNSKLFAQQILSLLNIEKFRKKYPVIVGSVVTVSSLENLDLRSVYIPDPIGFE